MVEMPRWGVLTTKIKEEASNTKGLVPTHPPSADPLDSTTHPVSRQSC
jgi:hypothetical protein